MARDPAWPKPPNTVVELTRAEAHVSDVPPGHERAAFLEQISKDLGIDASDLDRPLDAITDHLGALDCVAVAEAVWKVQLGPRSGTVSEIGRLATGFPTLRALIEASEKAARGETS